MRQKITRPAAALWLGLSVLLAGWPTGAAHANRARRAWRQLTRQHYAQARQLIDRALDRHPRHPGATFVLAHYFLADSNPAADLDSARVAARAALRYLRTDTTDWGQRQLARLDIDSLMLRALRIRVDSLGYARARAVDSVAAYQRFIDDFSPAAQITDAVARRNALAFADAKRQNTYEAYRAFLDRYPDAAEAAAAREIYDLLLFEGQTKRGRLADYEAFLRAHPANPYASRAALAVYHIITAPHTPEAYARYLTRHPTGPHAAPAWAWLRYLRGQNHDQSLSRLPWSQAGRLGLIDQAGRWVVRPEADALPPAYVCGVTTPYLLTYRRGRSALTDSDGQPVSIPPGATLTPLTELLLLDRRRTGVGVVDATGATVLPPVYTTVAPLEAGLLSTQRDDRYGLVTYAGAELLPPAYDEIDTEGSFVLLQRSGRYAALGRDYLYRRLEKDTISLRFAYTDVGTSQGDQLLVERGTQQGVIDLKGETLVPLAPGSLTPTAHGWLRRAAGRVVLYDRTGEWVYAGVASQVLPGAHGYGLRTPEGWGVLDPQGTFVYPPRYDSLLVLADSVLILFRGDTVTADFGRGRTADWSAYVRFGTLGRNRTFLTARRADGTTAVFATDGRQVLPPVYTDVSALADSLLLFRRGTRFGLADTQGQERLPARYEGIGLAPDGRNVTVVRTGRYGLYLPSAGTLVPPRFEAPLLPYPVQSSPATPNRFLVRRRDGTSGLVDAAGRLLTPRFYDDLQPWLADTVWVRDGDRWYLLSFPGGRLGGEAYDGVLWWETTAQEAVARVEQAGQLGVLSSRHGRVLPPRFDEIERLTVFDEPRYRAVRLVGSDVYEVSLFDPRGKLLRQMRLDEAQYDQLYCEE